MAFQCKFLLNIQPLTITLAKAYPVFCKMFESTFLSWFRKDEIDVEVIMRLLSRIPDAQLKNVKELLFPEPLPHIQIPQMPKNSKGRPGPRSIDDWNKEIRYVWAHSADIEVLEKSRLAKSPVAQKLAASDYGGRTIGCGLALQAVIK